MRVYVPSTAGRLQDLLTSGGIGPAPFLGHAVTDDLRAEFADGGDEEWEYVAMSAAAQDSVGLLTEDDPPRRVVVAVDTDDVVPAPAGEPTLVEVHEVVPLRQVASVLVDGAEAETDVAAAIGRWNDAMDGDEEAAMAVERCFDHELGWYGTQEIGALFGQ